LFSQHWAMEALTSYFTDKKKEDEVQVKSQTVGLQDLLLFYCCCCCCCVCASLFLGFCFFSMRERPTEKLGLQGTIFVFDCGSNCMWFVRV
jgi:hypothetical protein